MLLWNGRRGLRPPREWMNIRSSHKVAIFGFSGILLVWLSWNAYANAKLRGITLDPIEPGRVNIIAISPEAGYCIVVANQIAFLVEVPEGTVCGNMEMGVDSLSTRTRLPLRELLETLQGDEVALGTLTERLNEWSETDLSPQAKVWTAEDIRRALDGDAELEAKLVADLNVSLDGTPLGQIDLGAIIDGIIIDSPVEMTVPVGNEMRTLVGRVREVYQPQFCRAVWNRMRERFNPPEEYIIGIYREEADKVAERGRGEDVRLSLANKIDTDRLQDLTIRPKLVLANTLVLLNEDHITSASFVSYDVDSKTTLNDITIGLTDVGRNRLWKYSHDNQGFQLLFVVDTIAIAAPKITTELVERTIKIRRVPSKELVEDAVQVLNDAISERSK